MLSNVMTEIRMLIAGFPVATNDFCLNLVIPPVIDVFRIGFRNSLLNVNEKTHAFPTLSTLMARIIQSRLDGVYNIVPLEESKIQVIIIFSNLLDFFNWTQGGCVVNDWKPTKSLQINLAIFLLEKKTLSESFFGAQRN